jgi:hypothetical protein
MTLIFNPFVSDEHLRLCHHRNQAADVVNKPWNDDRKEKPVPGLRRNDVSGRALQDGRESWVITKPYWPMSTWIVP